MHVQHSVCLVVFEIKIKERRCFFHQSLTVLEKKETQIYPQITKTGEMAIS